MTAFQFLFADHGDPYMPFPANTPTVDDLPGLGLQDVAQLPVELLAILQREIDERMARTKAAKARLDGALTVRYATRAAEERQAAGKDTGTIRFDDLDGAEKYSSWQAYSQSKLANVLFSYELARRLTGSGVTVNALHPGFVRTNFARNNGRFSRLLVPIFQLAAISPEKGAETMVYLASSPEVAGVSGSYFDKKKAVRSAEASYDEAVARQLWEVSAQMVGLETAV